VTRVQDRFRHLRAVGLLIVPVFLAVVAVRSTSAQAPPPSPVRVGVVKRMELEERRQVTGELRATNRSNVASIEPGQVVELSIEEGDVVAAGAVLAVLDSRRLRIEKMRLEASRLVAQAVLAARTAELELRNSDLDALRSLDEERAANPKELSDARSQVKVATARKEEATRDLEVIGAQIDLIETRLSDTTITAPFDGVIAAKHTELGQWIGEGDPVVELVANHAFDAWIDIPQRFAGAILGRERKIAVRIDATLEKMPPRRLSAVPIVDEQARSFSVYVRIPNEKGTLAPGMSVTAWIPTGRSGEFLTAPRDALLRNEAGFYVYAARKQGEGPYSAVPVPVELLFQTDRHLALGAGALREGDLVVVEGNERLHPMAPISFDPPGESGVTAAESTGTSGGG
jgi:RND family efflux transporter MFP subunit